jgi:hypothetical protein
MKVGSGSIQMNMGNVGIGADVITNKKKEYGY